MTASLIFATRPSALARWQTEHIISLLKAAWPKLVCETKAITTQGDRIIDKPLPEIGGKGLFTHELEEALRNGRVDAAVHSLKDLPTEDAPGLTIGSIPARADARDAWVCPAGDTLDTLPDGAKVGTSSNRRRAQLLARRPGLAVQPIRGNVDTRLRKVRVGHYDAVILAVAGLTRLGLQEHITEILPSDVMLPAPGQGALAVQCRDEEEQVLGFLAAIEDRSTRLAVTAERTFLETLGGGCSLPVGAYATVQGGEINLNAVVVSPVGDERIEVSGRGFDPRHLGAFLAEEALSKGAGELLAGMAL